MGGIQSILGPCGCGGFGKSEYIIGGIRVRVVKLLAEGGFSFVFHVKDDSGSDGALKRVLCQTKDALESAKHEVEMHRLFEDEHVMPLLAHEFVESTTIPDAIEALLLMPLAELGSVQDALDRQKENGTRFSEQQILRILLGTCKGLRVFHTRQDIPYAHRDIKPANIMLDAMWTPMLMDFGSVRPAVVHIRNRRDALKLQDLAAETCTSTYRPPELHTVTVDQVDESTDMFSLGCTLYAMCHREPPFDGSALAALSAQVRWGDEETSLYSPGLRQLAEDLMSVEPSHRPSIHDTIVRIEKLLEGVGK